MNKILLYLISMMMAFFLEINSVLACTDFRLTAKDGTIIISRSMEFAIDLKSNLKTSHRGRTFNNTAPDGQPGLMWKAKYGYVSLDGFGVDGTVDGMNEYGLSFEYLYLPDETTYQTLQQGQDKQALSYTLFGDWVLSNFKSVNEVREALSNIVVFGEKIPSMNNMTLPAHASIYDATGQGIVVEFVNGKMVVYDNKIGVLTNSPTYDWQITNLRNYINLSPVTPTPVMAQGITFVATGQGAGMVGLPGDISPPSRFVKTAMMLQTVLAPDDAIGALNLAQHIINNVDIPLGFVREAKSDNATNEYTQWVVFKDLTHRMLYFRTYHDLNLHAIALDKLNFAENASMLKMPLETRPSIQDVTIQFLKSSNT